MNDSLITAIIFIHKQRKPILANSVCINSEAMILGGDVASSSVSVCAWLIVATVAISTINS